MDAEASQPEHPPAALRRLGWVPEAAHAEYGARVQSNATRSGPAGQLLPPPEMSAVWRGRVNGGLRECGAAGAGITQQQRASALVSLKIQTTADLRRVSW